ncbi:unnamed protein product [Ostreobium quekettii]|uniref:Uncharacterized protein n=1 Tax=Ostreobium quekettii TaxID=121088 RepID=A0A8S1JAN1_9CHLO|nr:unnamed protein product [Ostreobium quekettii]|eukprot:evm.model.scf_14.5 EVM.evm.TU.scf_14.5   scf_14:84429-86384(-)
MVNSPLAAALLSFESPALEARYCAHRTATFFFAVDRYSAAYRAGAPLVILGQRLLKPEGGGTALQYLMVSLASAFTTLSVMMAFFPGRWAVKWREPVTVFLRGTIVPATVLTCFLDWNRMPDPPSWISYIFVAFHTSGLSMTSIFPLAMPVLVKHHLPLHAAVFLLMVNAHVPRFCYMISKRPDSHSYVLASWRALSSCAWNFLNAMQLIDVREDTTPEVEAACGHMFTWLYIMVGLVVPTYVMWMLENQSRAVFVEREIARGSFVGSQMDRRWQALPGTVVFFHAMVVMLLAAVCWEGTVGYFIDRGDRMFV